MPGRISAASPTATPTAIIRIARNSGANTSRLSCRHRLAPGRSPRATSLSSWITAAATSGVITKKLRIVGIACSAWLDVLAEAGGEALEPDAGHDQLHGHHDRGAYPEQPPRVGAHHRQGVRDELAQVPPAGELEPTVRHGLGADRVPVGARQAGHRLGDLVRRHARVGDAQRVLAALDQEVGALHEHHTALAGELSMRATSVPSGRSIQRK